MPVYLKVFQDYNPQVILTRWGRFSDILTGKLRKNIGDYLRFYGLEAIKRFMPKGGKGVLEDALKTFDESTAYKIAFVIKTGNPEYDELLKILEYGSAPHTIRARNAEALAFLPELLRFYRGPKGVMPAKILGEKVFVDAVEHPGTRAYRMFERGLNDIRNELRAVINNTMKESIDEIVRMR